MFSKTFIPYFHVVFTVPQAIAEIAAQNKAVVYGLLFRATADTLRTIAADPRHLGAAPPQGRTPLAGSAPHADMRPAATSKNFAAPSRGRLVYNGADRDGQNENPG